MTNTSFWLKRIAIMGLVLLGAGLAIYALNNVESRASGSSSPPKSMAENVTNFYSEFRQNADDPIGYRLSSQTIYLGDNEQNSMQGMIEAAAKPQSVRSSAWQESVKERAFAPGLTLKNEAQTYAAREGLSLVWDLDRDFSIQTRFLTNGTIVEMLDEFVDAIEGEFIRPISVYMCEQHRVLVVSDRRNAFLLKNCTRYN